jgi:iron complex outermembrane receptor protein
LSPRWTAFAAASLSHSLIQDNVIYAYGPSFDADDNVSCPGAPDAPAYFFCPDGTYGIYDYRDPNELRMDAVAEAMATGRLQTGKIEQDVTVGGELFLRSVRQPGVVQDGVVQAGAVYAYIGAENIYQPLEPMAIESPLQAAEPRMLWEDNHQSSLVLEDRVHLPGRVQLVAGGRYDSLRDHNYSAGLNTDKPVWLPQYAMTFAPARSVTLYANYGVQLSLGPQAPWWVDNSGEFLAPYNTRQVEVGAKYEPSGRILLTADVFRMHAPFFYPKLLAGLDSTCSSENAGGLCFEFESEGREGHKGLELSAQGTAASWLRVSASAAGIDATAENTGTLAYDGKQVINVAHLRMAVFGDVALPHGHGLAVMPGWSYTSPKEATRDNTISVPGYNIFDLGLRYTPGGEGGRATFRVYASNVADKHYWSDTGASAGDTFLWLGAPALVRLSARYTF